MVKRETKDSHKKTGIWERKSKSEIVSVQERIKDSAFSIFLPSGISLVSFSVLCFVFTKTFNHGVLYSLLASSGLFCIAYCLQIMYGQSITPASGLKICDRCLDKKRAVSNNCSCGGCMEPLAFYQFVESKHTPD